MTIQLCLSAQSWQLNSPHIYFAGGNVGIGTSSPQKTLDVAGEIRSNAYLRTTGVGNGYGYYADDGVGSIIFSITRQPGNETRFQSYGYHTFYSGNNTGSEKMRIDPNGYVGIGTATPTQKLHVVGNLVLDPGTSPALYTGTGSTELNRFLALLNSPNLSSASGLKAGGILVSDSYSYANPGKNDLIVKGNVGIGTTDPGSFKLAVNGKVWAQEVQVALTNPGPDYVFEPNYKLLSLEEIKNYIDQHKHLPEVPSAKEMETNGVNVSEMNMLLLRKIEELTLHLIEQNKIIAQLQEERKVSPDLSGKKIEELTLNVIQQKIENDQLKGIVDELKSRLTKLEQLK